MGGNVGIEIRDLNAGDECRWRELWADYNTFYEAHVAEAVTAETWRRIMEPGSGVGARVAQRGGRVAGFGVFVLHPSTWTIGPSCYLEDLFVDPASRGLGVGRALVQDLLDRGRECGWSRLYWHTRAGNEAARRLYDSVVSADDFVRYRIEL